MMPDPIAGSVEILAELKALGTPLYCLTISQRFPKGPGGWDPVVRGRGPATAGFGRGAPHVS